MALSRRAQLVSLAAQYPANSTGRRTLLLLAAKDYVVTVTDVSGSRVTVKGAPDVGHAALVRGAVFDKSLFPHGVKEGDEFFASPDKKDWVFTELKF